MTVKETIRVFRLNQDDVKKVIVNYYAKNELPENWDLTLDAGDSSKVFSVIVSSKTSSDITE